MSARVCQIRRERCEGIHTDFSPAHQRVHLNWYVSIRSNRYAPLGASLVAEVLCAKNSRMKQEFFRAERTLTFVALADRYHELMDLRNEGFRKYRSAQINGFFAPPFKVSMPTVGIRLPASPSVKIGPLYIADNPPIKLFINEYFKSASTPVTVLEIGPGKGTLARHFRSMYPDLINDYFGIERDVNVKGPYTCVSRPAELRGDADLLIASEVAEHMSADEFYDDFLIPAATKLSDDGVFIMGVPNALSPHSIFLDFSHVQAYPWYDLYAILRLAFKQVDVYRTHYVWSATRLLTLLPRIALTKALEFDWCDGIVCRAHEPLKLA